MKKYTILIVLLISMISSIIIFSQSLPHTINYQGVLKDAAGVVVPNGDYTLKFTIYESDVTIWTETKSITVNDGIVNTLLGSITPIDLPFDNEYWIGITIGTDSELSPRIKLSSVPYSYMSMNVADGSITAQKLNQMGATTGQVLKWNGATWIPSIDEIGSNGLTLPFDGTTTTEINGTAFKVTNLQLLESAAIYGEGFYGVWGYSTESSGRAVYGLHQGNGNGYGVVGISTSTNGHGVVGTVNNTSGKNYGVYGTSQSADGIGVYGYGKFRGVEGISLSTGVYGVATETTGVTFGVSGETKSPNGVGVVGFSTSTTRGTAIYGAVDSQDGYSGSFHGGRFYVSGNVGIGTQLPDYRLVVEAPGTTSTGIGAFRNSDGENKVILRQNSNGSGAVNIYRGDNTVALSLSGDGYSAFNGGRVGIGTDTPTQMLHVVGNAYKTEGGTAWATSSDIRLKDVLGNYEKGLNEIISLQPVRYIYKKDNPRKIDSSTEQVGFVAQDVQKIFPEAVTEAEDGYLDFNIHSINIALVNAVKELKAENDELKARLEKIEKYLNTMSMK
jgi:hypothetical protein